MSDQPGDVLDEAAKLFDALIRRVGGGAGSGAAAHRDRDADGDVWSRATAPAAPAPGPAIATGAPECRDCPICRAIAIKRRSGGDVGRHLRDAGRSLFAAALDVADAFDRTASGRPASGETGSGQAASGRARRDRPPEASESPRAGRSERSDRPGTGEPWSAATGGDPIDIG
ncbi:hypothetical protein [Actinomadura sp. 9N215]|uniref:hypothetical protein n=1 Tax=Actinomadura sp. 9N215 TaxID=3375150 RepID=UPI00378992A1